MKTIQFLTVFLLALIFCQGQPAQAAPIGTAFTYQGHLYDTNNIANGQYDFQFSLFDDPNVALGSQIGSDVNEPDTEVVDGYFTVDLDFGNNVFGGEARWLEIGVRPGEMSDPNEYTILSPRQEITPVPYALQTRGIYISNDGKVGIGTTTPASTLDVAGDIHSSGPIASGNSITIDGINDKITASSGKIDFDDEDLVTTGKVGIGMSTPDPEAKLGVVTAGIEDIAVIAEATHPTGDTVGIEGIVYSSNGVAGSFVNESGSGRVLICHSGADPYDHAFSVDSDGDIWVEGRVFSRGTGTSIFEGNVSVLGNLDVGGTLSKLGGTFKIDHPLDPENKYLSHSFIESPDMMNVYNGNVVLDENGGALIELPGYFEALNTDFRYQLTCIGGFASVYIAEEISNNHFKIAGGESAMKVSWQVTGIRQDAFAKANPIVVEQAKSTEERGYYLYPQAYGFGEDKSITHLQK